MFPALAVSTLECKKVLGVQVFAYTSGVVTEQDNRITMRYDDVSANITIELIPKGFVATR